MGLRAKPVNTSNRSGGSVTNNTHNFLKGKANSSNCCSANEKCLSTSSVGSSKLKKKSLNAEVLNSATKTATAAMTVMSTAGAKDDGEKMCTKVVLNNDNCWSTSNNFTTSTTSIKVRATFRSSSTSAIITPTQPTYMRPQTLNVHNPREMPSEHTQLFFGEVLNAWRAKARCNVVPVERTLELFHELSFHPNDKQISEMLQTAKMLARKSSRQSNGLTFGEFCVLAADLKRFRTASSICSKVSLLSSLQSDDNDVTTYDTDTNCSIADAKIGAELRSSKSLSNVKDCTTTTTTSSIQPKDASMPVEVFLGGSCNPTTWRADVAIPTLKKLGISFYNPQVSDWTPDLIELEHRAKEKARVLFFVMDSETRASAGAIEAAHIAGQNCKQLVLVLHPYKPNQNILDEHISQQEYIDLVRNQLILRELVTRRGLSVLDNIPLGLQRTKDILAGIRDPPSNIASILVVVRGAFDRINPVNDFISFEQCQRALSYLGYAQSLLNSSSLSKIIASQREFLDSLQKRSTKQCAQSNTNLHNSNSTLSSSFLSSAQSSESASSTAYMAQTSNIDFDLFCVISAYLSVLQQEIHESGCISPIKGTNVPPPPVYLTNMQGDEGFPIGYFVSKNISRTSSNTSVPNNDERQSLNDILSRSRDSGTSSPQPLEPLKSKSAVHLVLSNEINAVEEESDSNDSVFSSCSSINSINCGYSDTLNNTLEMRDVYLGGSCFLRTKWRQEIAMPYLKSKGVTFHLPALHESIQQSQLDLPDKVFEDTRSVGSQERTFKRIRQKCQIAQIEEEVLMHSEESYSWLLPPVRPNLYNPSLLDSSTVLLFVITNETRSLAPMTLAAHCIGLMYNVVLAVQMLPDDCVISNEKLTPVAIKDYNRGRSYLIDLAKRQGVPVFNDIKAALECAVEKVRACTSRTSRCD